MFFAFLLIYFILFFFLYLFLIKYIIYKMEIINYIAPPILALIIAWTWIVYFEMIDIFEKEKYTYLLSAFVLGGISTLLVFSVQPIFDYCSIHLSGEFFNDFYLYWFFRVGFVEEIAKLIPFLLIYYFCKKQLNEPIDYIIYISLSALGFATVENTIYFYYNGPSNVFPRGVMPTISHMIDSSLVAYGFILYHFHAKKYNIIIIPAFFFLAVFLHAFYDFWASFESKGISILATILLYLLTISIFNSVINNALNNSSFFSYKKIINSYQIIGKLLMYYSILLGLTLIWQGFIIAEDVVYLFFYNLFIWGFILIIIIVRLSRYKLIKNRWNKIKIELPFSIESIDSYIYESAGIKIRIKGEAYNEAYLGKYFNEYVYVLPLNKGKNYLKQQTVLYIKDKLFLKNDEVYYLAYFFPNKSDYEYKKILIKPKKKGTIMVNKKYPIVSLLKCSHIKNLNNPQLSLKNFNFLDWGCIKPICKNDYMPKF